MTYQTTGIILKITDRGEADRLFSIYTKENGKITALGRGTKKIQSKLNGQLQPFSVIYLTLANGKNNDQLIGAESLKVFLGLKKNLRKIILGTYGLELVEKLTRVNEPEPEIFALLLRYFSAVEKTKLDLKTIEAFQRAFALKLLAILGLQPPKIVLKKKQLLADFLSQHLECELKSVKLINKIHS